MKGTLVSSEIAEPYAQALLSVAQNHDLADRFGDEIRSLRELLKNSPELEAFLTNPVFKESAKKAVLEQIMGSDTHPYLRSFLMLLVDKRRISFIDSVCEQFLELLRKLKNTVLAEVTSATELNEGQQQAIADKVKSLTGASSVEMQTAVDPNLIGGVVIKVGSQIFDTSIRGQLRRISLSLNKAI